MHPRFLRSLFDATDFKPRVFVAMSFDSAFHSRFTRVIEPAIGDLSLGDRPLQAHRVDRSIISDSIISEIIEGISTDIAVLADITTIGRVNGRAVRNGNVLYELGLAHAIRRPEHVLAFRSDDDPLLFDVSGIRVHTYDPDGDPKGARTRVATAIADSLRFARRLNRVVVDQAAASLDPISLALLMRVAGLPSAGSDFEDLAKAWRTPHLIPCFHRLLDLELIRLKPLKAMSAETSVPVGLTDLAKFAVTRLGAEVLATLLYRTGVWEGFASTTPEIAAQFERWKAEHYDELE